MRRYLVGLKRVTIHEDVFVIDAENVPDAVATAEELELDWSETKPVSIVTRAITSEEIPWGAD